jgi:hypothetical protein
MTADAPENQFRLPPAQDNCHTKDQTGRTSSAKAIRTVDASTVYIRLGRRSMTSIRDGSAAILATAMGFCYQQMFAFRQRHGLAAMYLQPSPGALIDMDLAQPSVAIGGPDSDGGTDGHGQRLTSDMAPMSHPREPATPRIADS